MSSAGLERVCLYTAVLEQVCVCCRSRAVVSAADLGAGVCLLQAQSRCVCFSFRAGVSAVGLE